MHEILIESHGPMGCDVKVTLPDGTEIKRIRQLTIYTDADEIVTATLEVSMPHFKVSAVVKEIDVLCPVCQETITHHCHPNTLGGL